MDFKLKKLPKSQIEIEIEISAEELGIFIEKAISSISGNLEIKGFRRGTAPRNIVEEHMGENAIMAEAAELAINDNYRKVLLENKIEAIGHPDVQIIKLAKGNPFVFKVSAQVLPKVELPDYKKIAKGVKREEIKVEEKEVQETLDWIQKTRAKNTLKNGAAEKGDFVEVEYQIISPEIPELDIGKLQNDAFTLGEGHFLPGFEEAIVNMKSGEEKKEIELQVPADFFQKEIAGKTIKARLRVKSVQLVELPDINDDFARGLGKFGNLEDLKRKMREGLVLEKEITESQRIRGKILEKISQNIDFEIPEVLIELEKSRIMGDLKQRVSQGLKISFEDYLSKINKTEKEICDSLGPEAQKRVKGLLVLKEISKLEKIEAAEKEIKEEINKLLRQYQNTKEAGGVDLERLREYAKEVIVNEKTLERLESFAGKSE